MSWTGWLRRSIPAARIARIDGEHAPALAAIHAETFARPWSSHDFEALLAEKAVVADGVFVGRDSEPAGFVVSRRMLDEAEILSVAIAEDQRGRGFGRALLASHLQELATAGVRHVHLEVEAGNGPALGLYRRLGFRLVGRREGYYLKPDGSRVAALTMTCDL